MARSAAKGTQRVKDHHSTPPPIILLSQTHPFICPSMVRFTFVKHLGILIHLVYKREEDIDIPGIGCISMCSPFHVKLQGISL